MRVKPAVEAKIGSAVESTRNFAGLELLRVLCAFGVILSHYQHFFYTGYLSPADWGMDETRFPFHAALNVFYGSGNFAVSIFWVISGFIFFWKYARSVHERRTGFSNFFMLRFSRLYPLHAATLLLVALLQAIYFRSHGADFIYRHNDALHFILQVFFVSNWLVWQPLCFNGPIWSVSAEILIYLLFFGIVFLLRPGLLLCLGAALFGKLLTHFNLQDPVVHCFMYFFVGGLLQQIDHLAPPRIRRLIFVLSALVAMAIFYVETFRHVPSNQTLELLQAASIVNSFVLLDLFVKSVGRISWVGNLTYSSYLIHFPVQLSLVLVLDALHYPRSIFLSPVLLVLFMTITFGLAWVIYDYYEVPMQSLIRGRWFAWHKRAAVPVSGSP